MPFKSLQKHAMLSMAVQCPVSMAVSGSLWQSVADQAIAISAVLPASLMHFYPSILFYRNFWDLANERSSDLTWISRTLPEQPRLDPNHPSFPRQMRQATLHPPKVTPGIVNSHSLPTAALNGPTTTFTLSTMMGTTSTCMRFRTST